MAVIDMIACGLIEIDESNFKAMRREVRAELQPLGMRLHSGNNQRFTLARKRQFNKARRGRRSKRTQLHHGDFVSCCKAAAAVITPSDHKEL